MSFAAVLNILGNLACECLYYTLVGPRVAHAKLAFNKVERLLSEIEIATALYRAGIMLLFSRNSLCSGLAVLELSNRLLQDIESQFLFGCRVYLMFARCKKERETKKKIHENKWRLEADAR